METSSDRNFLKDNPFIGSNNLLIISLRLPFKKPGDILPKIISGHPIAFLTIEKDLRRVRIFF
jgi:hypothetical protein